MRKTKQRSEPVTAGDVRGVRFPLIRRGGYDPRQVDPFLELVARSLEDNGGSGPKVDAQYVHSVRFAQVRRGGYAPTAVDAFLDRIIDTLDTDDWGSPIENGDRLLDPPTEAPPAPLQSHVASGRNGEVASAPADPAPTEPPAAQSTEPESDEVPSPEPPAAEPQSALEIGRAHLQRLKTLYEAGLLSDREVTVLAERVKRQARELHQRGRA